MTDREKIISYFEYEVNKAHGEGWDFVDLSTEDAKEILALLKEQEFVEPEIYLVSADKYKFYRCSKCKTDLHYKYKYCPGCGRQVKWE